GCGRAATGGRRAPARKPLCGARTGHSRTDHREHSPVPHFSRAPGLAYCDCSGDFMGHSSVSLQAELLWTACAEGVTTEGEPAHPGGSRIFRPLTSTQNYQGRDVHVTAAEQVPCA